MRFKEFSYLLGKIVTSSLAMIVGIGIGTAFIYFILPQLNRTIAPQVSGYQFNIFSNTLGVLVFCVVLNLLIVTFVFERIPSVSLSFIIFSIVSKTQNIFYLSYIKLRELNAVDFIIFVSMFVMLGVAGIVYTLCKRYYKTEIIEGRLRSLFSKYGISRGIENNTIKITKEIKEPDLWGVFYKKKMADIEGILEGYADLLTDPKEKQNYLDDVKDLNLDLNTARRLITTGVLAATAVACVGCMIFEPSLIITN